jgi:hypothetical protein
MKLDILKKIIREEVKGAIQEELKDILLEAIRSPKPPIIENRNFMNDIATTTYSNNNLSTNTATVSKEQLRESYRNILGETAASFNTSQIGKPLQLTGTMDTASPNGKLPDGEVPIDMIIGLLNSNK